MRADEFEFTKVKSLLGLSINDRLVQEFFGESLRLIERDESYGSLEFKSEGVGVSFEQAAWIAIEEPIESSTTLYLSSFFFYGEGRDGYSCYLGHLPNGVRLGDRDKDIILKMGEPDTQGGGTTSRLLGFIQPWYRYVVDGATLSFDFDSNGKVNLVSLCVPIPS